ncbi:ABC transporter substrate-binding protein, partial [Rhodoplanes sp. SY1]|uniref:ABC transporter substrate-binding protein n=1 Tax=Rhodoplanes sp. SY1 TaxID=3166646 RepID=UPI0038B66660
NAAGGVNGKPIELIKYDTGSDPKQASIATRKLVEDDKVVAIVGPYSSGEAGVAFNDAERLGVVMIPNAASTPGLTKGKTFAWRMSEDEDVQFRRLLDTLKRKGVKAETAAIIYVSDEPLANVTGTKLFPTLLKDAGIKYGPPIAVQYKSFDIAPQVAKIINENPDLVAVAGLPESASKILRELNRNGFKGRMIGSQLFADPNNVELFGNEAEGTLFVSGFWRHETPKASAFADKFVAENEKRGIHKLGPRHTDAQAYDTVYLLKQLMEAAKVTGDPAKVTAER